MIRTHSLLVFGCLLLGGCHSAASPAEPPSAPPVTVDTANKPETPPAPAPAPTTAPKPNLTVPEKLKGAAYEYYGLANSKPVDYEFIGGAAEGITTGSLAISLKDVKDGKAYYEQVGSGGLDKFGVNEYVLDDSGLHVVKSSMEQVEPNNIEFPNDVTPGHHWTSHEKTTAAAASMDLTTTYTVKGVVPIKTKRGTLQALEITSTSEGTNSGQKIRMQSESYYVKGLGLAKQVIKTASPDGKSLTITQQLAD